MPKISATTFETDFPQTKDVLDLLVGGMIQHKKLGRGKIEEVVFSPIPKITVVFLNEKLHGNYVYRISNLKDLFIDIDLAPERFASLSGFSGSTGNHEEQTGIENTPVSFLSIAPSRFKNFAQSFGSRWKMLIGMKVVDYRYGDGKIVNVVFNYVPGFFILFPGHSNRQAVFCSLVDFERYFTQLFLSSDLYIKIAQSEPKKNFIKVENPPQLISKANRKVNDTPVKPKGKPRTQKIVPVKGSLPKTVILCPECKEALRLKNLDKHYAKTHPEQPVPEQVIQVPKTRLGQLKKAKRRKPYWQRAGTKFSGGVIYPISMKMIRVGGRH